MKLRDERIEELQKQLDRKVARRKEIDVLQNSLGVPFDESKPPSPKIDIHKPASVKSLDSNTASVKSRETVASFENISKQTDSIPNLIQEVTSKNSDTKLKTKQIEVPVVKSKESLSNEAENKTSDEDFKDSEPGLITIEEAIHKEIKDIAKDAFNEENRLKLYL